jgi:hypothetical protein
VKIRLYIIALGAILVVMSGCTPITSSQIVSATVPQTTSELNPSSTISGVISLPSDKLAPNVKYPISTVITDVQNSQAFPGTVILGKPAADAITLSLSAKFESEAFIQLGTAPDRYITQTAVSKLQKNLPLELQLQCLQKDTQYYYRVCHRAYGDSKFSAGARATFHTQRAAGQSFVFTVDADPHWDNNADPQKLRLTFQNILNEHGDFNIDLGDTFMTEKLKAGSYAEASSVYNDRRSDFDIFGSSIPLFLTVGNHDGEIAGAINKAENALTTWARKARVNYYPNPTPDGFYDGNRDNDPFIGPGENYYTWQWGDALFVVLDPYWYSPGGGKNITGWIMTLGKTQYDWVKRTLESSQAKFKFVFAHSLVGGFDLGTTGNMRGGTEAAGFFEWGGRNEDGSWGFAQYRQGWSKPVHQLLLDNHVTAFFHGHDHFFGKQELNGIIYQECPQPGSINDRNHAAELGYKTGTFIDGAGHLRITVAKDQVKIDFIRTYLPGQEPVGHQNGEVAYSYTIHASS